VTEIDLPICPHRIVIAIVAETNIMVIIVSEIEKIKVGIFHNETPISKAVIKALENLNVHMAEISTKDMREFEVVVVSETVIDQHPIEAAVLPDIDEIPIDNLFPCTNMI
jgi:hypothetical protein